MKQLRFFSCVPTLALTFLLSNLEMRPAHAVANFVFHEQSNNFVATPTCPDGGTDTNAGRYVENVDRSSDSGFQVFAPESYSLKGKIEFQFFTDNVRVYYTTDGSNPVGAFGVGSGTTQVVPASYASLFSDQTQSCGLVDVIAGEIPPQPAGTTVKYIIGAWHSGGGAEIFANSGDCAGCTPCSDSSTGCATVFQYQSIAAVLTVNSLADPGDGACDPTGTGDGCTLRDALQVASNISGASTINFAPGLSGAIEVGEVLPPLMTNVTLQGPGANVITVRRATGAADFRLLTVSNFTRLGPTVSIGGLTLEGGKASGTFPDNAGGALHNDHGIVTLNACRLTGNTAELGGAIYNDGTSSDFARLTLNNCTLDNNSATNIGGAIFNDGLNGGAVELSLTNCTLSQNSAVANGGAVYNSGTLAPVSVAHCTFADNTAVLGGAIYNDGTNGTSADIALTIDNTVLKAGTSGGTIENNGGTVTSGGYNLSSDAAGGDSGTGPGGLLNGTEDIRNTNPLLGPLQNNGGPTPTHVLLSGSPARNAGDPAFTPPPSTDQRGTGFPRVLGGRLDIGAVEVLSISINDVTVTEGNTGTLNATFTISLSDAATQNVMVSVTMADGTATAGNDYNSSSFSTTFSPGETSRPINVAIRGDLLDEPDETFFVNLSNPIGAIITDAQGVGTITDNDATPSLSIADVSITEGNTGSQNLTFTVTLSAVSGQNVSFNYVTSNGTAAAGKDFNNVSGTATILAGQTNATLAVPILGDVLDEANEIFYVLLSSPVNAGIARGRGVGTITDNDAAPSITVDNVTVVEGHSGGRYATFTLRLSSPSGQLVRVTAQSANGTATAGSDYTALPPTVVSFTVGYNAAIARVLVQGDVLDEPNENFVLNLSSPVNATIADNQGIASITDDDATPSLSINDVSITEGNSNTKLMTFTVTRTGQSANTITVNYATANSTARSDSDYVAKSGTLSFTSTGPATKTISVTINGDTLVEPNEIFYVILSGATNAAIGRGRGVGTITNDDSSG